jgi:hypothetical protein
MKEDLLGRQVVTQYATRDALVTASVTLTTGTNTTLISGDSDYPLDILEITFANQSSVAAQVTLKDDGTAVKTLEIPAGNTLELAKNIPIIQGVKGGDWTLDMEDITGTTVVVEAVLMKNR